MGRMKTYFSKRNITVFIIVLAGMFIASCNETVEKTEKKEIKNSVKTIEQRISQWKEIKLTTDISQLSDNEKEMLTIFIDISKIIDDIFWQQNFGKKEDILNNISGQDTLEFVKLNYGPWDIIEGKKSIIPGYDEKPLGAQFYPKDIKYLPFINLKAEGKLSPYTLIKRDDSGDLYITAYHNAYKEDLEKISELMLKASELTDNEQFATYLKARAEALLIDKYLASDQAWMQVKDNKLDFLIGPVETRLDNFFHNKAAYETYVLIRNEKLSEKAKSYARLLTNFQQCLPMDKSYKEQPLTQDIDFGVYDAVYYAGISNYGGKMLSLNRPYDIQVLKKYGSRKMMFKNVMDAKLNNILMPIAKIMIDSTQVNMITSNAFSEENLLYEIGDKLGFNKTLKGDKVKDALKDYYTIIDKTRADLVKLYLAKELKNLGEIDASQLEQHYLTYVANVFRIVRLGDGIPEAKAGMLIFNFFIEKKAVTRNENGTYFVNFEKMNNSIEELTTLIHKIEQDGDYKKAKEIVTDKAMIKEPIKTDINKIHEQGVPIDVRFKQGKEVLGL